MLLDKVNYPKDLKSFSLDELTKLCSEIRELLIKKILKVGGHLAPNLGVTELTVALHYVFDTPKDQIIFDVSHQSYVHKILTGRKDGYLDEKNYKKYTNFSNPDENEYDVFKTGHCSSSISFATGLAKARDMKKEKFNIITIIGDGSLTGGLAYEGLNNGGTFKSNFIIIVNDNEWSIAENHGSLVKHLQDLRESNGTHPNNLFKCLGFDYIYVEKGNEIEDLVKALNSVKNIDHPVVVHIHTKKGKGYKQAEDNPEVFHGINPALIPSKKENYLNITTDYIFKEIDKGNNIVAISAATPLYTGLTPEIRIKLGEHYHDVAIAEQDAVTFLSGIGKNGGKGIFFVNSTFLQRAYDQIVEDLALNKNPATILIFGGGINSQADTHLGIFDIPMLINIPDLICLNPTNKEEYLKMLDWSVNHNKIGPCAIRIPQKEYIVGGIEDNTDYSILNKFKVGYKGKDVAIIGLGYFYKLAKEVKEELKNNNIDATLINPIYSSGIDVELLNELKKEHKLIVTLEDGVVNGGFGEKIASFYGTTDVKVLVFGAVKEFTNNVPIDVLYKKNRLTKELICEDVLKVLNK